MIFWITLWRQTSRFKVFFESTWSQTKLEIINRQFYEHLLKKCSLGRSHEKNTQKVFQFHKITKRQKKFMSWKTTSLSFAFYQTNPDSSLGPEYLTQCTLCLFWDLEACLSVFLFSFTLADNGWKLRSWDLLQDPEGLRAQLAWKRFGRNRWIF